MKIFFRLVRQEFEQEEAERAELRALEPQFPLLPPVKTFFRLVRQEFEQEEAEKAEQPLNLSFLCFLL